MTIFGVILFASFILTSCGGNSIESDAKKYAELMCKAQKLATEGAAKAATGDILVFVADDFRCPQNWDNLIVEKIGHLSKSIDY